MSFSAIVLAAGRSTRMGRDKALLETEDGPLWQRQRDILARGGAAEIFLSARPDQEWARHAAGFSAILPDAVPAGAGPLAGIAVALERAAHAHVAVLAIDLPQMTETWFGLLRAGCSAGVGVVGRRGDFFEPLAAIYPRELKSLAQDALAAGAYALQPLLTKAVAQGLLRVRPIAAAEAPLFENWNAPR